MADEQGCDVIVLGVGSGGENVATTLAQEGHDVVAVTDGRVGGECPFVACMPSKVMLHDAAVGRSWADAVVRRDEVVDHRDDAEHAQGLRDAGATLVRGRGRLVGERRVEVAGVGTWSADHVVLATGAAPLRPPIDGLDSVDAWTSDELWSAPADARPRRAVVLGAGAIGCEAVVALRGFGTEVVLVERAERLLPDEDAAVAEHVLGSLRAAGAEVHLAEDAARVDGRDGDTVVTCASGLQVRGDRLVLAVGKEPNRSALGLASVGLDEDALDAVDDHQRVGGLDWLHAVGDVTMQAPYTHAANLQAWVVTRTILGVEVDGYDPLTSPRAIYTRPPFLAVGADASRAEELGLDRAELTFDLLPRATTDGTDGVAVLFADGDGVVRGFAACGDRVDEVGAAAALAVQEGVRVGQLARLQAAFPTHAELLPALARQLL